MKLVNFFALISILAVRTAALAFEVNCADADLSRLTKSVYVSPQGSDSSTCGQTASSPCKTIQQGITNCSGEGCGVLVRYGVYDVDKPIEMADGVSLYGSCIFGETTYKYRSTIIGHPAIRANRINKLTTVQGFVILYGSAPAPPGQASIAMSVRESNGLVLSHNTFASGQGGPGSNGTSANGGPGGNGSPATSEGGGNGGLACPASPPERDDGKGGKGADYNQVRSSGCFLECNCSDANPNQSVGKDGNGSGDVRGGSGRGRGAAGCSCRGGSASSGDGGTGGKGNPGSCGIKGGQWSENNKGSFRETTWIPSTGHAGDNGRVGSGGGGGGSGGYATYLYVGTSRGVTGVMNLPGRPGGGGGGGGCGGHGGQGGQQGGASIPLVLFASSLTAVPNTNVLIPGPGGRGGTGARGGTGGMGGTGGGGRGGQKHGSELCGAGRSPGNGGNGGDGGQGGAGAGGAGGNGGPSFGIALISSQLQAGSITIYTAQPGNGGARGLGAQNDNSQCKAPDGEDGRSGFADNSNSIVTFSLVPRRGEDNQ